MAKERIGQVALLSEEELMAGTKYCIEELKLIVEPSGACGVSALLAGKIEHSDKPITVVLSGSNLAKKYYPQLLEL